MDPELHREIYLCSKLIDVSLNQFINTILEKTLESPDFEKFTSLG
jgi:predicted HicB family RNase H-like nuclease